MGKSSTANSLFNEAVAQVTSFQQDTARPQAIKRSAHGFELSVIDTPGLLDSDCISTSVSVALHDVPMWGHTRGSLLSVCHAKGFCCDMLPQRNSKVLMEQKGV